MRFLPSKLGSLQGLMTMSYIEWILKKIEIYIENEALFERKSAIS